MKIQDLAPPMAGQGSGIKAASIFTI